MTNDDLAAVRAELAPHGRMRAGLNRSNFLLVNKGSSAADPQGVVPDLAREIALRLGVAIEFLNYDSPGAVADAASSGAWDVAFLGAEPARAAEIDFTRAYVEIECTYLVSAGSPLAEIAQVDQPGVRICASARSAYELYLRRTLRHAQLVLAEGLDASYERFVTEKLDALAGLRPRLLMDVTRLAGARILEGRFTAVQQAIGTPKGRPAAAAYLRVFAEEAKASGFVARAIERHSVRGLTVAPTR